MKETHLAPQRRLAATPAQLAIHNNFRISVTNLRKSLVRAAFYLLVIQERGIHELMGFDTLADYTQNTAGFSESQTRDLLRMGRRLRAHPEMARAVASGSVSWSKARMIAAHVSPETEKELCELARTHSEQMLREVLKGRGGPQRRLGTVRPAAPPGAETEPEPGVPTEKATAPESTPDAVPPPAKSTQPPEARPPRRLVVSLSFTPEDYARWEALLAALREAGNRTDTARLHLDALAAHLEVRSAGGREDRACGPGVHVVVLRCPDCDRASLPTSRGEIEAPKPLLASADCDALIEHEGPRRVVRRHIVPPRLRRIVLRRDRFRCQAAGCGHVHHLEVHHRVPRSRGGKTEDLNLVTLCSRCHRALHEHEDDLEALRPPDAVS